MPGFSTPVTRLFALFVVLLLGGNRLCAQTANFTSNVTSGCAPLVVQFTSTSTGTITGYSWTFGTSATSALANPSTTFITPGTYTITLTVTGPGGSNTKTQTNYITVYPQPTVSFTANSAAGCPAHTVQFSSTVTPGAPGPVIYGWNFGDGNTSTQPNPAHTYPLPGLYSVTLVVTNGAGCSKTIFQNAYINVYTPPVAGVATNAAFLCNPPYTTTLTNTSTGFSPFTTAWNFGDNTTGTGPNVTHTYANPGTYTVTMIVTDAHGCKDTGYQNITAQALNAGFTAVDLCVDDSVTFTSTTTPTPTSISWNFGNSQTGTGTPVKAKYAAPGNYTVKMIVNYGPCADTETQTITINPTPVVDFTWTPVQPCPAPQTITFTGTGAATYHWDFGDGSPVATGNPISHTFANNDWYTVTVHGVSGPGCIGVKTKVLKIYNMILTGYADPGAGCAPHTDVLHYILTTTTNPPLYLSTLYPYSAVSQTWTFGDGPGTSTALAPTHTYANPGVYNATVTVTTANGCTIIDTFAVVAGQKPTPNFYTFDTVICAGREVHFVNTTTGTPPVTYAWNFGDGNGSSDGNPTHTYQTPGTFTVKLTAQNYGCIDSIIKALYIVVHPPSASFTDSQGCQPSKTVWFKSTSIGETSRIWYFGDNTTDTAKNPVHTYPLNAIYTTYLVTFNNVWGCSDTVYQVYDLTAPPLNLSLSDSTICPGDSINLNGIWTGAGMAYRWRIDNDPLVGFPLADTLDTISYRFWQPGFHTITFLIANGVCRDSVKRTNILVVGKGDAGFTQTNPSGCVPLTVTFTDTSHYAPGTTPGIRYWDFGNGIVTSPGASQIRSYPNSGIYDVRLIITDNIGCKDTMDKPLLVDARKPSAVFYASDTTACFGQTISFVNSSAGATLLTYSWDFGDGTPGSVLESPTHQYYSTGPFTVRLIVTDATGCKDTLTRFNHMKVLKPHAAFTISDTFALCPPLLLSTANLSTGSATYNWDFGTVGSTSTLFAPVNTYVLPGNYTIRLIAYNSFGCADTATATVKVLGFAGGLSYTPLAGCNPLTVQFTANLTNVPNLIWDFADGVTQPAVGATTTHTYTTPGAYLPKLIFGNGAGCVNSSAGLDTIKVDAVVAGFKILPPCEKSNVQFIDTSKSLFSPVTSWLWTFPGGLTSTQPSPYQTYNSPGNYVITLISTNSRGCRDTVTQTITIYPLPVISAGVDTVICKGDAAILMPSGGTSYLWSPGSSLSCTACTNPMASPAFATTYLVQGTDANGCSSSDNVKVNIQTKTTSIVAKDTNVCLNKAVQLFASGATVYQWSPADGLSDATAAAPFASPPATMTYMIVAKEGSCIPDTHYVKVTVYPLPDVTAGADATIIAGSTITLQGSGFGSVRYAWIPDSTLSCTACTSPVATPNRNTTYRVVGYTQFGCTDSSDVTIRVLCSGNQVFLPNTFTPNGDNLNDRFYPRGKGIDGVSSFRVYNRWGEVIYERKGIQLNDESVGWDGSYKGAVLPPDVYVYVIEATCVNGEPVMWKGDITLIR